MVINKSDIAGRISQLIEFASNMRKPFCDVRTLKEETITAAHRYAVILSVFDSDTRIPEMATGTLLSSARRLLLVTAGHVLKRFLALGSNGRLQIGTDRFTLQSISAGDIRFSRDHDLVAVNLQSQDLDSIGKPTLSMDCIASLPVKEGDIVAFVGYPGYWKEDRGCEVGVGSYEFFGRVRTVEPSQFSILVDPSYEIRISTTRSTPVSFTESIGGLSGAPVFSCGQPPRLVGWIYEGNLWSRTDHKLYAVHGAALKSLC